jgi:hypothetical protein
VDNRNGEEELSQGSFRNSSIAFDNSVEDEFSQYDENDDDVSSNFVSKQNDGTSVVSRSVYNESEVDNNYAPSVSRFSLTNSVQTKDRYSNESAASSLDRKSKRSFASNSIRKQSVEGASSIEGSYFPGSETSYATSQQYFDEDDASSMLEDSIQGSSLVSMDKYSVVSVDKSTYDSVVDENDRKEDERRSISRSDSQSVSILSPNNYDNDNNSHQYSKSEHSRVGDGKLGDEEDGYDSSSLAE